MHVMYLQRQYFEFNGFGGLGLGEVVSQKGIGEFERESVDGLVYLDCDSGDTWVCVCV